MRSHEILGVALLAAGLVVQSSTVLAQDAAFALGDVAVAVVDQRLVLTTADGTSYVLAALDVPEECPAAGGRTWACGEGARQALAAAVKGEVLECSIVQPDDPPALECYAQTRNLNQWMLRGGRARLVATARGSVPSYDAAEHVARETGAMLWYDPDSVSTSPPSPGELFATASPPDLSTGNEGSRFLVRGVDGQVLTYGLSQPPPDSQVRMGYFSSDEKSSIRSAEFPYVAAIGLGEFIVHQTAPEGSFAFAAAPADETDVPLAYVMDSAAQGRPYTAIMFDDHLAWTSRQGVLQPVRLPLDSLAERRGATLSQRRSLGGDLPASQLRAGVWSYDSVQVVVAEDPFGCEQFTWCRFTVLERGDVVLSEIAREAPALVVVDDGVELVWETPEEKWKVWSPSP
jgi:endonuclease YncB( thermonuclease family)